MNNKPTHRFPEVAAFTEHLNAAPGQDYHLRIFWDMLSKTGKE
jgi:hypothetical protein